MFFGFEKKKAEMFLISLFKITDKTLSKEKVNLLISGSVSSAHLNSKHFAYVIKQKIYRTINEPDMDISALQLDLNKLSDWANK